MNSKDIGERSEGMVIAALLRVGKVVLLPFGDNQRYDVVIDEGGKFLRIQCKTGRLRNGVITFQTCSSQAHRGRGKQNYRGQIEAFAVYCPETDGVYVVPVDEVGVAEATLRVGPPARQANGIRWAAHYELRGGRETETPPLLRSGLAIG